MDIRSIHERSFESCFSESALLALPRTKAGNSFKVGKITNEPLQSITPVLTLLRALFSSPLTPEGKSGSFASKHTTLFTSLPLTVCLYVI